MEQFAAQAIDAFDTGELVPEELTPEAVKANIQRLNPLSNLTLATYYLDQLPVPDTIAYFIMFLDYSSIAIVFTKLAEEDWAVYLSAEDGPESAEEIDNINNNLQQVCSTFSPIGAIH